MKILLAVPESDCHSVVNYILYHALRERGHQVVNLGTNCSVAEIADNARKERPDLILITAQNGHAIQDLQGIGGALRKRGILGIPLWLGGRLTIAGGVSALDKARLTKRELFTKIFSEKETLSDLMRELDEISYAFLTPSHTATLEHNHA